MKCKFYPVFIFILFVLVINGCIDQEKRPDIERYQEARWGMSKGEIRSLVKLPLTNEVNNTLMYSDVIEDDNVTRMYMFDNNERLFAVMIVFELPSENEEVFRSKFIKIYNRLAFKYSDADKYIDEGLDKRGLSATWEFKKSGIFLQLIIKKPFNKLVLGLVYLNKEYAEKILWGLAS